MERSRLPTRSPAPSKPRLSLPTLQAFYRRFYIDPRTQVMSRAETVARAKTVATLVRHLDIPVRTILDAGCGLGWMRRLHPDKCS